MNRRILLGVIVSLVSSLYVTATVAETRRDSAGGGQASKKAQYMIKQLHNEKQELQAKLAELQGKYDALNNEHEKLQKNFDKSSANNEQLVTRIKGNVQKYNELADKYREAVSVLRKANMDNQYMVRAVQEREQWISECSARNEKMFEANSDLLNKYSTVVSNNAEIFTGTRIVEVENEEQDYRFKLEDLQVTRFKPKVDTNKHTRQPDTISESSEMAPAKKQTSVN
jgi:chromosome segregation ATPase